MSKRVDTIAQKKLLCTMDIENYINVSDSHVRTGFFGEDCKFAIGFYTIFDGKEEYHTFHNWDDYYWFITTQYPDNTLYIFAHNGGKYDFQFMVKRQMFSRLEQINSSLLPVIHRRLNGKKSMVYHKDSMMLATSSLKDFAETFGKFHKDEFEHNKNQPRDKLWKYLYLDCKSLYSALKGFSDIFNLDIMKPKMYTIAQYSFRRLSKAIDFYNHKKMGHDDIQHMRQLDNKHDYLYNKLRYLYYGGRTEAFRFGKIEYDNINYYDINSLYPFAMTFEYPDMSTLQYNDKIEYEDYKHEKCYLALARVRVKNDVNSPCITRHNNKLLSPCGTFYAPITTDLMRCFGDEIEVLDTAYAFTLDGMDTCMKDFINENYKLKEKASIEGDETTRYLAKIMLNSSYGKFGQKRERQNISGIQDNILVKKTSYRANPNHNMVYAIMICDYARNITRSYMKMLGYDNVLYTDTDSIITPKELPKKFIHETRLGGMSVEHQCQRVDILAPKLYRLWCDDKRYYTTKGVSKKQIDKMDGIFDAVLEKGEYVYNTNRLVKYPLWSRLLDKSMFMKPKPHSINIKMNTDKRHIYKKKNCVIYTQTKYVNTGLEHYLSQ